MYKHRYVEEEVLYMAQAFKIVLIVGARQTGKSTLLHNLFPQYPIVTFNPIYDVKDARKDPEFFLSQFTGPVILDEIQFAPELLAYLKIEVDKKDAKGQYFLTGSQNLSMLKTVAESMAGRVAMLELSPMIIHEITESFAMGAKGPEPKHWLESYLADPSNLRAHVAGLVPSPPLTEILWRGGYPGVLDLAPRGFTKYFSGYLATYVDRDIRTQTEVEELMQFENFVTLLAALTAREINYEELGREIAASGKTAKRWLALLRSTYMWRDVNPFVGNILKRVTERRKGYFIDTGFACYLLRITSADQLLGHPQLGFLFETYVNNTIFAVLQALPFGVGMYHWRAHGGAEVDVVLESGNKLYPIEVKIKSQLSKHDARGIKSFQETYKNGPQQVMPGIIVYSGIDCYWVDHEVLAVPWNLLMSSVGDREQ